MQTELFEEQDNSLELDKAAIEKLRKLSKENLFFFCRAILGFKDFSPLIHKPICKKLQDHSLKRKIIVMPRTWFKSTQGSVGYPIWRAINDPNVRILIAQNSHTNACKKLAQIKQIFEKCALFRLLFPEILPTSDCKWSSDVLEVNRSATHPEGTFEAAGTGTAVTSRHYDVIIEDDTVSPEKDSMNAEMQQPTAMDIAKAIGWHKLTMPLLVNPNDGEIIIIGTRWAEEDLIGYVVKNFPEYHVITRAVRENDGVPATKEEGGIPAWPDRFPEKILEEIEKALGPWMFSTLMMNYPISAANMVFRRDWIRYFESHDLSKLITCITVDPAASDKEMSGDPDYTVVMTTGVDPIEGQLYVLGYDRARMNPGETIDKIFAHYSLYSPVRVIIEGNAYQKTLKYWLEQMQKRENLYFHVDAPPSIKRSKEDRIRGLQPFFANMLVSIRSHMDILESELLSFPKITGHDDCADALSMQIPFWNETLGDIKKRKQKKLIENPFSGISIIDELVSRAKVPNSYPYDMGIMRDRIDSPVYARSQVI